MAGQAGNRAVVLGAGMAGLLAARVLAGAYQEVLIVDRDGLDGNGPRRGVPQGRHAHGLLARGQQILEELFPGFTQDAIDAGVPTADLGELRWYFNGRRLHPATTGLICVAATRPLLESQVRTRVHQLAGVKALPEHDITGLITDDAHRRVTGVRVQPHSSDSEPYTLEADLVVDATGRGSRTPVWLEESGYRRPEEDRIRIDLSYTTRLFRLPDEAILQGDLAINPVASPSHPRGAFFSRTEDGLCVLSLTGVLGDSAPADLDGFRAWTRTLPVPDVYDAIKDAEPVGDGAVFRYPASVRRRYERLDRFLDRLLVLGDAVCSFNPVYGQGMTVAALEALVLRDQLRRGTPDPVRFLKAIAGVIDTAWDLSTGGDLGFPGVEGHRTLKVRMGGAYMAKLQAAATQDSAVTSTFMQVAGFVAPPQALMSPRMVYRVLRGSKKAAATP